MQEKFRLSSVHRFIRITGHIYETGRLHLNVGLKKQNGEWRQEERDC